MPKTRKQKEKILDNLEGSFSGAKAVIVSTFSGISVKDDQDLRKDLLENEIEYSVVRKTLLRKALEKKGWADLDIAFAEGNIAVAISSDDEVAPAKGLYKFSKAHEDYRMIAGIIIQDGQTEFLDEAEMRALAMVPGREELLARAVGSIRAPLSMLIGVMQGNLRNFVYTLKAISEQKS